MKHTPGPWFALEYAGYYNLQTVDEYSDTNDLLNIEKDPNAEANAKLAAKAPELFQAVKGLCIKTGSNWTAAYHNAIKLIREIENS